MLPKNLRPVHIENPRRVLVRKSLLGWLMRKDYHTVPTDLVYTRTPEGRRFLLKARTHSMSRSFQNRAERLKSWQ